MDVRGSRRARLFVCAVLLMCLAGAASAFAQQGQATLTGTIVDNAGVVPGATVTITNAARSAVRTATSDGTGVWRIPTVPPGRYSVKVEMEGFKELTTEPHLALGRNPRPGQDDAVASAVERRPSTSPRKSPPCRRRAARCTKNLSGDMLTSVQVKGRDIFGMLKILPGVDRRQRQPRLRAVGLGPLPEHQRRQLAQQEHDD